MSFADLAHQFASWFDGVWNNPRLPGVILALIAGFGVWFGFVWLGSFVTRAAAKHSATGSAPTALVLAIIAIGGILGLFVVGPALLPR